MGMAEVEIVSKTAIRTGNGRTVDFIDANPVTLWCLDEYPGSYFMKVSDEVGMMNPHCVLARKPGEDRAYFFVEVASRTSAHQTVCKNGVHVYNDTLESS